MAHKRYRKRQHSSSISAASKQQTAQPFHAIQNVTNNDVHDDINGGRVVQTRINKVKQHNKERKSTRHAMLCAHYLAVLEGALRKKKQKKMRSKQKALAREKKQMRVQRWYQQVKELQDNMRKVNEPKPKSSRSRKQFCLFNKLSDDLVKHILSYCDCYVIGNLLSVKKTFYQLMFPPASSDKSKRAFSDSIWSRALNDVFIFHDTADGCDRIFTLTPKSNDHSEHPYIRLSQRMNALMERRNWWRDWWLKFRKHQQGQFDLLISDNEEENDIEGLKKHERLLREFEHTLGVRLPEDFRETMKVLPNGYVDHVPHSYRVEIFSLEEIIRLYKLRMQHKDNPATNAGSGPDDHGGGDDNEGNHAHRAADVDGNDDDDDGEYNEDDDGEDLANFIVDDNESDMLEEDVNDNSDLISDVDIEDTEDDEISDSDVSDSEDEEEEEDGVDAPYLAAEAQNEKEERLLIGSYSWPTMLLDTDEDGGETEFHQRRTALYLTITRPTNNAATTTAKTDSATTTTTNKGKKKRTKFGRVDAIQIHDDEQTMDAFALMDPSKFTNYDIYDCWVSFGVFVETIADNLGFDIGEYEFLASLKDEDEGEGEDEEDEEEGEDLFADDPALDVDEDDDFYSDDSMADFIDDEVEDGDDGDDAAELSSFEDDHDDIMSQEDDVDAVDGDFEEDGDDAYADAGDAWSEDFVDEDDYE